jgi:hypothetical protein
MSWNYYLSTGNYDLAVDYIKKANAAGKLVWTWMSGDFGVDLKLKGNYLIFRNSGLKSQLSNKHLGMPVFINDPLQKIYKTSQLNIPTYKKNPVVGFCGQANSSLKQTLKEYVISINHLLNFKIGITHNSPQTIQSTSLLRAQLLDDLETSNDVTANFIRREKYRAGVTSNKSEHNTTKEFYDNIRDSHYVLCVRGGGNFSVRFYETLAMGRIPIFVNTDCLLPLSDQINWKKHCVWIESNEMHLTAQKVVEFHQRHTENSLNYLLKSNRELWEKMLGIGNFFKINLNAV